MNDDDGDIEPWTEDDAARMRWAAANSDRCLNCNVRIVYAPIPNPTGSGFEWMHEKDGERYKQCRPPDSCVPAEQTPSADCAPIIGTLEQE